jgi:hypothetical protein
MKYIKLGAVRAFTRVAPDKAQALKPLEEAAEVFGAWQVWDSFDVDSLRELYTPEQLRLFGIANRRDLLDEIADTIQACANLAAAIGVDDMTPYLARCEERNRERGRYGEGEPK